MLQTSVDADHNLVTFKNRAAGTQPTIDVAFRLVKRQYETFGPVKLLIDWTEYRGMEDSPHAAKRMIEASDYLDRVAFVVAPDWREEAEFWIRLLEGKSVKRFEADERDAAVAWLIGN